MQVGRIDNNYTKRYNPVTFKQILRNDIPAKAIKNKRYVLLITGPSGVGKDTIMNEIIDKFSKIVTHTTRAKREGEIEGKSYFFTTTEKFIEGIKNNEFVEYVKLFSGKYYGTKKETIRNALKEGKPGLLIVDVDGAKSIRENLKDDPQVNVVSIFIAPPSTEVLRERLLKRGTETPESIQERLERSVYEIGRANEFDAVIQNNHYVESLEDLTKILHLE